MASVVTQPDKGLSINGHRPVSNKNNNNVSDGDGCGGIKNREPEKTSSSELVTLPNVDACQLKNRLISFAPKQISVNPTSMCFKRPTKKQIYKYAYPSEATLEPLVSRY